MTPLHFKPLRIWPMPHCNLMTSPLSPRILILFLYVIVPEKSFPYPNLPDQIFIFFLQTQFRHYLLNKLPLTFSAKRINNFSTLSLCSEHTSINIQIPPYYEQFVYKLLSPISFKKSGRVYLSHKDISVSSIL